MNNLTSKEYIEYVEDFGIEEAEKGIKNYSAASALGTFFLIFFIILLQLFAVFTASSQGYGLKFSLIAGALPIVGPIFLMVKLSATAYFSALAIFLACVPCIIMCLYTSGVRKKRAYLHNAICMVAENVLISADRLNVQGFDFKEIISEKSELKKPFIETISFTQEIGEAARLVVKDIEIVDEPEAYEVENVGEKGGETGFSKKNSTNEIPTYNPSTYNKAVEKTSFEKSSIYSPTEKQLNKTEDKLFITSDDAAGDAAKADEVRARLDEIDRLIDEILGGKN